MKNIKSFIKFFESSNGSYCLTTHQNFKIISSFQTYPSDEELSEAVEDKYGKKVVEVEKLDRENIKFIFEDGSTIELLLRKDC